MPFKRAGWLQLASCRCSAPFRLVSMPFKRAGWLQRNRGVHRKLPGEVSMPFKRAGWLQLPGDAGGIDDSAGFNAL